MTEEIVKRQKKIWHESRRGTICEEDGDEWAGEGW